MHESESHHHSSKRDIFWLLGVPQMQQSETNLFRRRCTNAPSTSDQSFSLAPTTLYYLPGATGWTETFEELPTVLWNPQILTGDGVLSVQDGKFGFTISGAADVPVIVEACADLTDPIWTTVTSLTFNAQGTAVFTDPEAANQPGRYYRFRPE